MFSQSVTITTNCDAVEVDSRHAVADILSSMARDDQSEKTYTSLNSFSTAVPTRTTPTFTPTTLRNIEETFLELQMPPMPTEHQNQAGFVPPVVLPPATMANNSSASPSPLPSYVMVSSAPAPRTGRNMGGRRPNRDDRLTPEEEERRRVRRERNKMAAARCRKRRLDHTNMLLNETDSLEGKRSRLQDEIHDLEKQKEELQFILDAHKAVCKYQRNNGNNNNGSCGHDENHDVKPVIVELEDHQHQQHQQEQQQMPKEQTRLPRPVILPLRPVYHPNLVSMRVNGNGGNGNSNYLHEATGVAITTPSNGIINFDSMMDGGTGMTPISSGLTPMVPTCSHQQRSSGSDLSSPDSITPSKLVKAENPQASE